MPTKVNTDTGEIVEAASTRRMPENLRKYLIKMQGGKLYMPVAYRIVWFRDELGDEWGIRTKLIEGGHEAGFATVHAEIVNPEGRVIASGMKTESKQDFAAGWTEKAESGSIGRALGFMGFGTQFTPELDEGSRIVDSPQPARQPPVSQSDSDDHSDTGHERSRPNGSTADRVEETQRRTGMAWIKGWMKHAELDPADVGLRRYLCGCAVNKDLESCKDLTAIQWAAVKKYLQPMPQEAVLNLVSHYEQKVAVGSGVGTEDE
jgi:hypothetical protein